MNKDLPSEISEADAQNFLATFKPKTLKKRKNRIPYRIKIYGEFIQVNSGKTVWACLGHAKTALHNHWDVWRHQTGKRDIPASVYYQFLEYLQDREILEFIPCPEYNA
jgi:hypothetical protein